MTSVQTTTFMLPEMTGGSIFTGTWADAVQTAPIIEPATGQSLGTTGMVDADGIANAAASAAAAQREWAAASFEQRAAVLRAAARIAEENAGDIIDWLVRESGSTQPKAGFEASINVKALHEASALPSQSIGEILPSAEGKLTLAKRRPIGVVGVISPFNFPLYLSMRAVAPALALGNAVVLKPDPRTPVSGGFLIARIFELAGLPAGVLQVVPGDGAAGAAMTADPNIAMIQIHRIYGCRPQGGRSGRAESEEGVVGAGWEELAPHP